MSMLTGGCRAWRRSDLGFRAPVPPRDISGAKSYRKRQQDREERPETDAFVLQAAQQSRRLFIFDLHCFCRYLWQAKITLLILHPSPPIGMTRPPPLSKSSTCLADSSLFLVYHTGNRMGR